MKKIFTLAIALIAFVGVASAQNKVMKVERGSGLSEEFFVSSVEQVTFLDDTWTEIGTGTYTFSGAGGNGAKGTSTGCVLYNNPDNPTEYRIDNWITEGYPFYFTIDESTKKITVTTDTDTGYKTTTSSGVTGTKLVTEANDFTSWFSNISTVDYNSYYDESSNTYYFATAYYIYTNVRHSSVSYYGYSGYTSSGTTYDYETFVITSPAGAPAK